jgi:hypothetical protein
VDELAACAHLYIAALRRARARTRERAQARAKRRIDKKREAKADTEGADAGGAGKGNGAGGENGGGTEEEGKQGDSSTAAETMMLKVPAAARGGIFSCNDFCTGLIALNRMGDRVSELSAEERRKLLFGSDQIAP